MYLYLYFNLGTMCNKNSNDYMCIYNIYYSNLTEEKLKNSVINCLTENSSCFLISYNFLSLSKIFGSVRILFWVALQPLLQVFCSHGSIGHGSIGHGSIGHSFIPKIKNKWLKIHNESLGCPKTLFCQKITILRSFVT